jgi:hypothetical protein
MGNKSKPDSKYQLWSRTSRWNLELELFNMGYVSILPLAHMMGVLQTVYKYIIFVELRLYKSDSRDQLI